ncbi:Mid2 domain-containing protein [Madurella fahalii]|uniref:Mid2 domain-containing protein n=1 Tax=Madurella fahalii TaxID=1157608 RepID=A0ABQ0GGV7_9PEZI
MKASSLLSALVWSAGFAAASIAPQPEVAVRTRNLPGTSTEGTVREIHRRVASILRRNEPLRNSTSIDKSWEEAPLFSYTHEFDTGNENLTAEVGIEVRCVTCYIRADATAELSITGDFDAGEMIRNVTEQIGDEVESMTETAVASVRDFFGDVISAVFGPDDLDDLSFDNFTIDLDFDIDMPPLPDIQFTFQIDYLDLYMLIGTKITGATTLTIPLFKSQTPLGYGVSEDLEIGVFATMDLILSVEGEIDFTTGIHLAIEDPAGFHIALFSSNVSDIIFNGARFEFLPVTVTTANAVLKAILRVGMHAGLSVGTPSVFEDILDVGAGMEMGVFAHLAEFVTNVTAGADLEEEENCRLKLVEEYTLGLGAAAGATVEALGETWGPQPSFTIPIFYTTLLDACAGTVTPSPTPTATPPPIEGRQDADLETVTLTTVEKLSAVGCASPGVPLCPVHLQTTSVRTTTRTLVTAVAPGEEPTFPASVVLSVASPIPFGDGVRAVSATSGSPVSFIPPPPPETSRPAPGGGNGDDDDDDDQDSVDEFLNGQTGGVDNKLIIGLSVGLGVPFLIAVAVLIWFLVKRHRYAPVPKKDGMPFDSSEYQSPMAATEGQGLMKPGAAR